MSVSDEAVCARAREDGDRLHEVGICDRHAQARRAVRDVLDVRGAAEAFEEDFRLQVALIKLHIGCRGCGVRASRAGLLRLVVRLREELVLDIVVRPARRLVILEADDSTEDEEVDGGEAQADADLRDVRHVMVGKERNPVLHEAVDEAAAEVARKPDGVERRRERRRENRVQQIKQRRDEKEGEFQRLRDAAEHRRDRRGYQESRRLLALFRLGAGVDGERRARQAEDLAAAVQGEAALGEEVAQGLRVCHEVVDMSEPVGLDAAVDDRRTVDERQIDEVMEAGGQQDLLRERVRPDADDAARLEEELELLDRVLHHRPDAAEDESHRDHDGEADGDDEGGTFEDAEPVGDVRVVEMIVQVRRAARDEDRAEHAHVERLDVRDHRESCARSCRLAVVDAERAAVQREDGGDEVVEEHVDDEGFHGAARRLLLRKADGDGDGEEDRHLREHRPRALLDDVPEIVP